MEDRELLREYVGQQSESAFAELVARHVNLVYATALRVVREPATAQDVAQTVFIQLARKAWMLRDGNALVGWLYRAAYRAAVDAVRSEQIRRKRETEAMNLAEQNAPDSAAAERLAPLLDEAMQKLSRVEQNALLLHYFEGKTMREAGDALGISGPAAQMRMGRALEKLRTHFARSGVTVATGAITTALGHSGAQAAPAGLAANLTGASLAAPGGWAIALCKILYMSTKTKIILSAAVVVFAATMTLVWQNSRAPTIAEGAKVSPQNLSPPASRSIAAVSTPAPAQTPARVVSPVVPAEAAMSPQPNSPIRPSTRKLRADLATAIPELLRILEGGDYAAMVREYFPPNTFPSTMSAEQVAQGLQEGPLFGERVSLMKEKLKAMQKMNPVMGVSNGDIPIMTATYTVVDPATGEDSNVIFSKNEEGLWVLATFSWVGGPPRRGRRGGQEWR